MIQFNLLPDVKVAFLKARRAKHWVYLGSIVVVSVSLALLGVLLTFSATQNSNIKQLDKDIAKVSNDLKSTPDLAKILTIQNQLNSLPGIHEKLPVTSRLFGFIEQATPINILGISHVVLSFEKSSIDIEGTSNTLETVNQYVDTLKFTMYTTPDSTTQTNAFNSVVLTSYGRDNKGASYGISFKFDPIIFDSSKKITLVVPTRVTTRSQTELPGGSVFKSEVTN